MELRGPTLQKEEMGFRIENQANIEEEKSDSSVEPKISSVDREEDLTERWHSGAERFNSFYSELPARHGLDGEEMPKIGMPGQIQALFLGERAVVFKDMYSDELIDALKKAGMQESKDYIYNPEALDRILSSHKDVLGVHDNPVEYLDEVARNDEENCSTALGILLGFPTEDAKAFQEVSSIFSLHETLFPLTQKESERLPVDDKAQAALQVLYHGKEIVQHDLDHVVDSLTECLKDGSIDPDQYTAIISKLPEYNEKARKHNQTRSMDIYDIQWGNYDDSPATREHIARLKRAFEESGILLPEQKQGQNNHRALASREASPVDLPDQTTLPEMDSPEQSMAEVLNRDSSSHIATELRIEEPKKPKPARPSPGLLEWFWKKISGKQNQN